ncbi:MAG: PASTA domain-containing protein [Muribaculaceae bacterium]|nr:PASTA domain-containing protein [Muribaculaceae bacterium]
MALLQNYQPKKYAILINILIILAVAVIGIAIAYFSAALFTKHGQETVVPRVENMSYTQAIKLLHSKGFNVDIRDSLYRDDYKPGYVIEQFPKARSVVKPGRKIFLYINAVHPKEVVIDDSGDRTGLALKDWSFRQAKARLTELGFKNLRRVTVLGAEDRVIKLLANGKPIYQMEKVPVNAQILIEVSDGRLSAIRDSLYEAERVQEFNMMNFGDYPGGEYYESGVVIPEEESNDEPDYFEEPDYFLLNE